MEPELRNLIGRILVKDPDGRLTLDEILKHPWITSITKYGSLEHHVKPDVQAPRKNALLSADQKSKDWSTSKLPTKRPISQKSNSSVKSVGKRFSPGKLLEGRIRQLEKDHILLDTQKARAALRDKQEMEKKVREYQGKIDRVKKEADKRRQMIEVNEGKAEKLKKDIALALSYKK